jgi:branched-chain amino acid transport system substrate-binding protein
LSRKASLRGFAAIAVLAIVAAACSSGNDNNNGGGGGGNEKTVKLAFVGALTGAAAQAVIPGYQGASLAFDQANEGKFGDVGVKIELVQEDTQGSPTIAPPVATKVANDPDFVGVLGPNFSGESAAVGPTFDDAGIPFVTWSATNPTLATNGWTHWFRANGNDNSQGPSGALYISDVLKPNCAFVSSDDSTYGKGLAQIVLKSLNDGGLQTDSSGIGAVANGGTGETKDFSALITKAKQSGCTAMYYGGYDAEGGNLRAQMTQQGLTDVTLVGGDGIFTGTFTKDAGAAGTGTVATCPCGDITKSTNPDATTFNSDYKAKWGADPGIYSGEAYDVARIYIDGLMAGNTDRQSLTDYIAGVNYTGLTKTYSFQSNHELDPTQVKIFYWKDNAGTWEFLGLDTDVTGG